MFTHFIYTHRDMNKKLRDERDEADIRRVRLVDSSHRTPPQSHGYGSNPFPTAQTLSNYQNHRPQHK